MHRVSRSPQVANKGPAGQSRCIGTSEAILATGKSNLSRLLNWSFGATWLLSPIESLQPAPSDEAAPMAFEAILPSEPARRRALAWKIRVEPSSTGLLEIHLAARAVQELKEEGPRADSPGHVFSFLIGSIATDAGNVPSILLCEKTSNPARGEARTRQSHRAICEMVS